MRMRLVLAALLLSARSCRRPTRRSRVWRHATGAHRRAEIPGGLRAFRLRQSGRAEGRRACGFGYAGGFDSFNPILDTSAIRPPGIGYLYETLMTLSLRRAQHQRRIRPDRRGDVAIPTDYSSVTFRLRPEARWHDGEPITAEDVVWSFRRPIELNPTQRFYYSHVTKAEVTGEHEVTFTFDAPATASCRTSWASCRSCRSIGGRARTRRGASATSRRTTLEPPLGSGPYRIKSFEPGRNVVYERVPDYWAKDLNVSVGTYNFDEIRFDEYPRHHRRCWRRSRATSTIGGSRTPPRTGRPATTSRRAAGPGHPGGLSPIRRRGRCRASFRTCGATKFTGSRASGWR